VEQLGVRTRDERRGEHGTVELQGVVQGRGCEGGHCITPSTCCALVLQHPSPSPRPSSRMTSPTLQSRLQKTS
jgi:hypothetical protein